MSNCKGCGRKLDANEVEYCPACESEKSHKTKMEILKDVGKFSLGVLVTVVIFVVSGGKKA